MKKALFSIILVLILLLFSACGSEIPAPLPSVEPTPTPPAPSAVSALPDSNIQPSETPEPVEPSPAVDAALLNAILELHGEDISALYDLIGEPIDSSYIPSCMGVGDDGELYYHGFTVITYREGEKEIVWDVIVNDG